MAGRSAISSDDVLAVHRWLATTSGEIARRWGHEHALTVVSTALVDVATLEIVIANPERRITLVLDDGWRWIVSWPGACSEDGLGLGGRRHASVVECLDDMSVRCDLLRP